MFWWNRDKIKSLFRQILISRGLPCFFSSHGFCEAHGWSSGLTLLIYVQQLWWMIKILAYSKKTNRKLLIFQEHWNLLGSLRINSDQSRYRLFWNWSQRCSSVRKTRHIAFSKLCSELCEESHKVPRNSNKRPIVSTFLDPYEKLERQDDVTSACLLFILTGELHLLTKLY